MRSALSQTLARSRYEIIVVDNAVDAEVEAAVGALGAADVRYIAEPALGIAHARNRGIEAARGRLVAFMDDDALADPSWLESLVAAFDAHGGEMTAVGGPVRGIWEGTRPNWLRGHLPSFLSLLNYGPEARECRIPHEPLFGCNLATGREAALGLGGFRPSLGRAGARLLSSDEVDFQLRLRRAGGHVYYEPRASVGHRIPAERMTRRWFLRRLYAQGVSDAVLAREAGRLLPGDLQPPLVYRARRALRAPSLTLVALGLAYMAGLARGTVPVRRGPSGQAADVGVLP
jgi:glycosyltransferase involved in cell wall biosynthesis